MIHFTRIAAATILAAAAMVACGDDEDDSPDDTTGGRAAAGGKAGTGGTTATGGRNDAGETSTGGKATTTGGSTSTGGTPGAAGQGAAAGDDSTGQGGGGAGEGGAGGGAGEPSADEPVPLASDCDLSGDGLEVETILSESGDTIFEAGEDLTLTSDKVWTLEGYVEIRDGATLTIEPCTRIEGTKEPLGVLFVERGGKLVSAGTAARPILFTSSAADPAASDWGGIVLLGNAPTAKGSAAFEGVMDAPEFSYGGEDSEDSSGTITYTKIEYGGYLFLADKEVNGLSFASVGSGTTIHHVMVSNTSDDCFEWWGGNVTNADYLICNNPGDDMFDGDEGWTGGGKNWFGRTVSDDGITSSDPNGFEWDSLLAGSEPISEISATNVTLCGAGQFAIPSNGMVLRELVTGAIDNVVVTGWDFGVDARDTFTDDEDAHVTIRNSLFFGLPVVNPADNDGETTPGDFGFDEQAWFETAAWNNTYEGEASGGPFTLEQCLAAGGPADAVLESGVGAFTENKVWVRDEWTTIGGGW
jgi:hypothetical protein